MDENTSSAPAFDVESVYSNNTRFETSVWDLKLLFGQLDQHTGKEEIEWHTAVTLPWMQAKILLYFLRLNIYLHEINEGPIKLPLVITPTPLALPTQEQIAESRGAGALYEYAKVVHAEMFGG